LDKNIGKKPDPTSQGKRDEVSRPAVGWVSQTAILGSDYGERESRDPVSGTLAKVKGQQKVLIVLHKPITVLLLKGWNRISPSPTTVSAGNHWENYGKSVRNTTFLHSRSACEWRVRTVLPSLSGIYEKEIFGKGPISNSKATVSGFLLKWGLGGNR